MFQPPLEHYAILADLHTAPLISRQGSIDWLCLPRFDSAAVFSALLGRPEDGRWLMAPVDGEVVSRRYLGDTFILQTAWRTPTGEAVVTEYMPQSNERADLIRSVQCTRGEVVIAHELIMRFDYGRLKPWVRRVKETDGGQALLAVGGPDALVLHGPMLHPEGDTHRGEFRLARGEEATWSLTWTNSWDQYPPPHHSREQLEQTRTMWQDWADQITDHDFMVRRSLLVLKALTHVETGGIVAAATTSLPEYYGGERNWDYRFVWLRDSALTIETVVEHGLADRAWRDWLLRTIAGGHENLRIMYGIGGERLDAGDEKQLPHLAGYWDSRPVRIGNGAAEQYQADVVGEVMVALHKLRQANVPDDAFSWSLQKELLTFQEKRFDDKDHGIWEMRGDLHHFTHGRVLMWAAFDRGVRGVREFGHDGPADHWQNLADRLRAEVDEHGFNSGINSFTQTYDNTEVDASLLVLPQVGFCDWDDPRMLGTVARIERDLVDEHGFVHRYRTEDGMDGLEGGEYPFLICTFWLATQYAHTGRLAEAEAIYDRLVQLGGDLGLLSEEYDTEHQRLAGNMPQAFSHLALVQASDAIRAARNRAVGGQ